MHAGRQDIALLRRALRLRGDATCSTPRSRPASPASARSPPTTRCSPRCSALRVAKTASFTRWDARPLSAEQLAYAREDVRAPARAGAGAGSGGWSELGRLEWALEECRPLALVSDERDPQTIFERLPRVGGLNAPARSIARELVEWREQTAERQDRPVQGVLGDAGSSRSHGAGRASREELERIRGVGGSAQGRRAEELLDAVERAGAAHPSEPPPQTPRPPSPRPEDAPLVALAEALVRTRAREAGLAYELLAARADLQAIVAAARTGGEQPDVRTLRGWRRELVGAELLELLAGGISLVGRRRRTSTAPGGRPDARLERALEAAPSAIRCGCRLRTAAGTSRSR